MTASAFDVPEEIPLKRYPVEHDSPFDATAWYVEAFSRAEGGGFAWNGLASLGGQEYRSCVAGALEVLRDRGLLSRSLADRFEASAVQARSGSERGDGGPTERRLD